MLEYLSATSSNLKTGNYANLSIVLGNESCDLDSAVSAVVYAAFLDWQYKQIKCKSCTRNSRDDQNFKNDIFVPMLNVDRDDFKLKTEVAFCFQEFKIDGSNLVFRNDYDLEQLVKQNNPSITLVDHHILARKDEFLAPYVTEIIDHRPLDKSKWVYKDDTRTTIETVGSCTTLVFERIRDLSTLLSKDILFFAENPVCTELLHSTIVLDTANFSKEVKKCTPKDEEAILVLESLIKPFNYEDERKCKLQTLEAAKSDVSSLTAAQLFKKDVKVVGDVLVPSFPILIQELLKKPSIQEALDAALKDNGCVIALLLGMNLSGTSVRRDVAVYCPGERPELGNKLIKILQEWTTPVFQLAAEDCTGLKECNYFAQLNKSASRKQFIPAVNAFIESRNVK